MEVLSGPLPSDPDQSACHNSSRNSDLRLEEGKVTVELEVMNRPMR